MKPCGGIRRASRARRRRRASLPRRRGGNEPAKGQWTELHWRYYRWSYYRHIEMVDGEIGRVLEALEGAGQLDNTAIFFTADHGEEFWEHGSSGHGYSLHDENVRVPLILRHPSLALQRRAAKVGVVDLVAGTQWPELLDVLKIGGRYACAGAIAGPMVELDVRTLYLKDLTLIGCTFQEDAVFENLVRYIENNEIKPVVAGIYPLERIIEAQQAFLGKTFVGKLVLQPPGRD
mgnify:CR=1 FL=1